MMTSSYKSMHMHEYPLGLQLANLPTRTWFGSKTIHPPENSHVSPKKVPFQKDMFIFQPLFVLRENVSFQGITVFQEMFNLKRFESFPP